MCIFFSPKTGQTPEAQGLSNDSGFGHSNDGDSLSITYKDIEENIYDDPTSCQLPKDYGSYTKRADEGNNFIVVLLPSLTFSTPYILLVSYIPSLTFSTPYILLVSYIPSLTFSTPYILLVSGNSMDTTINKTHRQDITEMLWKVV
jgi:hypothetical protein